MNPKPDSCLLFDIDGTLVDTDALHLLAFNTVFAPYGHCFDKARFTAELQGGSNKSIMERFLSHLPPGGQQQVMMEKEATFRTLAQRGLKPMAGLIALLDAADAAKLPMVAVTNAPRANAELMLGALGIQNRFKAVIIGDELARGKPDPLPYLEGLRLAGAEAALSVAFEDSQAGIRSAVSAGIATIGIRTSLNDAQMKAAGATMTADDFADQNLIDFIIGKISA